MALESRPKAEIANVQALRGAAALLVVLSHVAQNERDTFSGVHFLQPAQYIGPTGVDLFFAISGFIMVYTNWNRFAQRAAPVYFLARRFIRIFPIYWIVTIAAVTVAIAFHRFHYSPAELVLALVLFPQHVYPPVGVGWSLVYEMYFYYIFAVAMFFHRSRLALIIAAWATVTIALNLVTHASQAGPVVRTLASPFNIEFTFGVVIGLLSVRKALPTAVILLPVSLLASGFGLAHLAMIHGGYSGAPYGGWDRCLVAGLPLALLLFAMVSLELRSGVVLPKFICNFGNASYSLYLWHELLASFFFRLLHPLARQSSVFLHIAYLAAAVVLTVVSALVLYHIIEKPITTALQSRLNPRRQLQTA